MTITVARAKATTAHINNSKAMAATTNSNSTLRHQRMVSLSTISMVEDTVPTLRDR